MTTRRDTSYDLLSNFLTRSFLDLVEKFHIYLRHPADHTHDLALQQAIQSFLFLYQSNPLNTHLLDTQIFTLLPEIHTSTPSRSALSHLTSFRKAKARYVKQFSSSDEKTALKCNQQLLTTYYTIIHMHQKKTVPPLFLTTTANDFILSLWEFYLTSHLSAPSTLLLTYYMNQFFSKNFDIAPSLLSLTCKYFPDFSFITPPHITLPQTN